MYFGFSGTVVWIIAVLEKMAGLELNLHDPDRPAVTVNPIVPAALHQGLSLRRIIHAGAGKPGYRKIPLEIIVRPHRAGEKVQVRINGKPVPAAVLGSLDGYMRIKIEIIQ
jgi:hypothetical protein